MMMTTTSLAVNVLSLKAVVDVTIKMPPIVFVMALMNREDVDGTNDSDGDYDDAQNGEDDNGGQ